MQALYAQAAINTEARIMQLSASIRKENDAAIESEKMAFATLGGMHYVSVDLISYCQVGGNYSHIIRTNGERILMSKTLKWVSAFLPKQQFVRVHASYITRVKEIRLFGFAFVSLQCGTMIPSSPSKRSEVQIKLARTQSLN